MRTRFRSLATQQWIGVLPGLVVSGICLLLYLRTIAPSVLGGDTGELQSVPYTLRLTHPTGYPLQTLVGKLWTTIVPIGSVAYRMNLFSALVGAVAVGLIYGAVRLSTGSELSAFLAALLLGISEVFWGEAVIGDKYALNACLLALVVFTLIQWSKAPSERSLCACAFCYGLSLTHHRSMVVFFPFLIGYWVWHTPHLLGQWRRLGKVALFLFLPLLLYIWLPIGVSRGLPPGTWQPSSLKEWGAYMLDKGYLDKVQPYVGVWEKLTFYGKTLLAQFTLYGVLLGLLGLVYQVRTRNPLWVFLAPGFVFQTVLAAGYQISRYWVFLLPSFVLFALWIGEGLTWLSSATIVLVRRSKSLGYGIVGITLASFIVLVALLLWRNYPTFRERHLDGGSLDIWRQDLKEGYLAQRFVKNGLAFVEPNSIIAADWEQFTPLWYFQQVEGWRPDVTVIHPIYRWTEALATGQPVHLARNVAGIGEPYHLTAVGTLIRVSETPNFQPPSDIYPTTTIKWENKIELVGYRFYQTDFSTGYVWPVSLYFRAPEPLNANYSISVRLFSEDGAQLWSEDRQHFVLGMYPTTRWLPGEVVGDYFEIPFPRRIPAGRYRLGIILYTLTSDGNWRNLTVEGSGDEMAYPFVIDVPVRR
jgi:hypothetical protein